MEIVFHKPCTPNLNALIHLKVVQKQTWARYIAILVLGPNINRFQTYQCVYVVSSTGLSWNETTTISYDMIFSWISLWSYLWKDFHIFHIMRGKSGLQNSSTKPLQYNIKIFNFWKTKNLPIERYGGAFISKFFIPVLAQQLLL